MARLLAVLAATLLMLAPIGVAVGVALWSPLGVGVAAGSVLYGAIALGVLLYDAPTPPTREVAR